MVATLINLPAHNHPTSHLPMHNWGALPQLHPPYPMWASTNHHHQATITTQLPPRLQQLSWIVLSYAHTNGSFYLFCVLPMLMPIKISSSSMDPYYLSKMSLNNKTQVHTPTQTSPTQKQRIHAPNPHPKSYKTFHKHIFLKCIPLTLILICFVHTQHKHLTTTKTRNTITTQWAIHNIEIPTTKDTPIISHWQIHHLEGKFHIHTKSI